MQRTPARRVLYRSPSARATRALIGLFLAGVTLLAALPVIASESPPPAEASLFVGLNSLPPDPREEPESVLSVAIRSNGCQNPALVEGFLERPESSWRRHQVAIARSGRFEAPTEAEIVLSGAEVERAEAGLANGNGPPVGVFQTSMVSGAGEVFGGGNGWTSVHNSSQPLVHLFHPAGYPPLGAVLLSAPSWPRVRSPLHFML